MIFFDFFKNFIYFTTITKQVIQLILIMFAFGWFSCGRKPECPEERHLSDLVTTWPSHMPTPGIERVSQRWETSALTLRQPDSLCETCNSVNFVSGLNVFYARIVRGAVKRTDYMYWKKANLKSKCFLCISAFS